MSEFVCHNCGKCCGPVPIVETERQRIEKFLKKHPSIRIQAKQKPFSLDCIFRDEEKGCLVYSARPKICRVYKCSSNLMDQRFQNPAGTPRLINECFGDSCFKDLYSSMLKRLLHEASKLV